MWCLCDSRGGGARDVFWPPMDQALRNHAGRRSVGGAWFERHARNLLRRAGRVGVCVAFIAILFFWCGPSAIFGRVRTIVVDAVKRVEWAVAASAVGAPTHVGKKRFERMPSFTNADSASPIKWVVGMFRVVTSAFHSGPRLVFVALTAVATLTMFAVYGCATCTTEFDAETPTRFGFPAAEYDTANGFFISAFTFAQPFVFRECATKYSQPSKLHSSHVDCFAHNDVSNASPAQSQKG
jgi:hypothetical protein